MKTWNLLSMVILIVTTLAGCGGIANSASGEAAVEANSSDESATGYTNSALSTSYDGALPPSSQLALGTLVLEGTGEAVTPDQAQALKPLWQAIQGGVMQGDAETNALLNQIETTMTADQISAIAAMQLTREDMTAWMQAKGVRLAPPEGVQGGSGDMSEEDRQAMMATRGAGGGGAAGFGAMSEADREAMRATAEASGMITRARGGAGDQGQLAMLAGALVDILEQRSVE